MEPKTVIYEKEYVNKNAFHRCKEPITINKVNITKLCYLKKIHMEIKVHLTLLDI